LLRFQADNWTPATRRINCKVMEEMVRTLLHLDAEQRQLSLFDTRERL